MYSQYFTFHAEIYYTIIVRKEKNNLKTTTNFTGEDVFGNLLIEFTHNLVTRSVELYCTFFNRMKFKSRFLIIMNN